MEKNPKSEIRIFISHEEGYTLVVFVMVIAVMAIMMASAVEIISFQMRREREAELIFRGQQYVEAIRLYKQKYGRNPMRLKELWEADPRVLRRNWIDPITGSEEWGLVFLGQEGRELAGPGGPGGGLEGAGNRQSPLEERGTNRSPSSSSPLGESPLPGDGSPVQEGVRGGGERVGPIVGVHSLSTDASIKIFEGRTQYNEWKFVLKETGQAPGQGGGQQPVDDGTPWGQPPAPPRPGGGQPGGGQPGGGGGGGSGGQPPGQYPTPPRPQPTGTPWG